jgi:membrane protein DedA with SNARE-associated domain
MAFITALFIFTYEALNLPSPELIIEYISNVSAGYGHVAMILASLLEGLFVLGSYLPGSVVVLSTVLFSSRAVAEILSLSGAAIVGLVIANSVNYALGYWGFYRVLEAMTYQHALRQEVSGWLSKSFIRSVFFLGVHANFMSVGVVCLGIARYGYFRTIAITSLSFSFWIPLQFFIVAGLGDISLSSSSNFGLYFSIILFVTGLFFSLARYVRLSRPRANTESKNQG